MSTAQERRVVSKLDGSRIPSVGALRERMHRLNDPDEQASLEDDRRAEHDERLDWMAGEIVQHIHGASDLRDLVEQVLHQAGTAARAFDALPAHGTPIHSDDEIPF